ncbi:MAG: hypothetical protein JXR73_02420 [Candidatus Omnitrophica bacterium]|nr:hypothetical protein [Candidatus Omnitrophota bacterium]
MADHCTRQEIMPWDNVPCHPHVSKIITRAIQRGHFGRTSLVFGPPGAGQGGVALAITMTFVCKKAENDFCGTCPECKRIQDGVYPDVIEMHPWEDWSKGKSNEKDKEAPGKRQPRKKKQYSVDHMRAVMEHALHLPYEGDLKFYIIHDAHSMNVHSSNSLLKILEEPHPHTRFILLTDQAAGILPTIRSRCWGIRLLPLEISNLARSLQPGLSEEKAATIARAAGGLPDQASQLMEKDYLDRRDQVFDLLLEIKKRESAVIESAESIAKHANDLEESLPILLRIVRDGVVVASQGDPSHYENQDRKEDLSILWKDASMEKLIGSTKSILAALEDRERFVNPSILMMDLFLQLRESMRG